MLGMDRERPLYIAKSTYTATDRGSCSQVAKTRLRKSAAHSLDKEITRCVVYGCRQRQVQRVTRSFTPSRLASAQLWQSC